MTSSDERFSGVSSEAVGKATGRSWPEWVEFLDDLGAQEKDHREIVSLIAGPGGQPNGWWQQSVAVGYEQARGLRVVGQTSAADYQIGVQKTLPVPLDKAWKLMSDGPGRDIWLGTTECLEFRKGERYETVEGSWGEIRSAVLGRRVRMTWANSELAQPSTLQLYLVASGERTSVRFQQERLSSLEERERMRSRWQDVLRNLGHLVSQTMSGD